MNHPNPTPIYRIIQVDNLSTYLQRGMIHAGNHVPNDGLLFITNHNEEIQAKRRVRQISCGLGGVIHDYTPFYFGYLSPMLLQLKTGRVPGYDKGQKAMIYLVSSAQIVQNSGASFVFSDGQGIATITQWYDDLNDLDKVDWNVINERYWTDNLDDGDRKRRKQAEFLIHNYCDWSLIQEIGVISNSVKAEVEKILNQYPQNIHCPINVHRNWYYN